MRSLKVCGRGAYLEVHVDYFLRRLEEVGLLDIELINLKLAWFNKRVETNIISNGLEKFYYTSLLWRIISKSVSGLTQEGNRTIS
jgi:hypothetical protein